MEITVSINGTDYTLTIADYGSNTLSCTMSNPTGGTGAVISNGSGTLTFDSGGTSTMNHMVVSAGSLVLNSGTLQCSPLILDGDTNNCDTEIYPPKTRLKTPSSWPRLVSPSLTPSS